MYITGLKDAPILLSSAVSCLDRRYINIIIGNCIYITDKANQFDC